MVGRLKQQAVGLWSHLKILNSFLCGCDQVLLESWSHQVVVTTERSGLIVGIIVLVVIIRLTVRWAVMLVVVAVVTIHVVVVLVVTLVVVRAISIVEISVRRGNSCKI